MQCVGVTAGISLAAAVCGEEGKKRKGVCIGGRRGRNRGDGGFFGRRYHGEVEEEGKN